MAEESALKAEAALQGKTFGFADQTKYIQLSEISGSAVSFGAGVDLKLRSALALRVGELDYLHSWHAKLSGVSYADALQFTSGLVLRFGTW